MNTPEFSTVGLVGTGAMGRGIAQIAAQAGATVRLFDTQADAVAKELGAKPSDTLAVQLGKYAEQMHAAAALKDTAQRGKAVTEARQQLSSIAGKPVTPEQAAKVDSLLGLPAAQPATVQ